MARPQRKEEMNYSGAKSEPKSNRRSGMTRLAIFVCIIVLIGAALISGIIPPEVLVATGIAKLYPIVFERLQEYKVELEREQNEWAKAYVSVPSSAVEVLDYDQSVRGAEDFFVEADGSILTGLIDGRIVRLLGVDKFETVARIGNNYGHSCSLSNQNIAEKACSRPLGIGQGIAENGSKQLYICDGWKGLIRLQFANSSNTSGDSAEISVQNAISNGPLPHIPNDITDSPYNGKYYFTDSSKKSDAGRFGLLAFENTLTGRLFSFDPKLNTTEIVMEGLHFTNGICITHDGNSLLVAETIQKLVHVVNIDPQTNNAIVSGTMKLPILPDNITRVTYNGLEAYATASFAGMVGPKFSREVAVDGSEINYDSVLEIGKTLLDILGAWYRRFKEKFLSFPTLFGLTFMAADRLSPEAVEAILKFYASLRPSGGQVVIFNEQGRIIKWFSLPLQCKSSSTVVMSPWNMANTMLVGTFDRHSAPCLVHLDKI